LVIAVGIAYILLIRRYRVTSGSTLPAKMVPQPDGRGCQQQDLDLPCLLFSRSLGDQDPVDYEQCSTYAEHCSTVKIKVQGGRMVQRQRAASNGRATAPSGQPATDGGARSLWFDPPTDEQDRRHQLTRERVVTEALAVIAEDGIQALTMRSLAARLGVVPGAVYHHVRNKQRLQDLILDNVLAEVDVHLDSSMGWTDQLKVVAHRLRQVLEAHPGVAGILKTRDPLGPHSLALAEALLSPLLGAGFADREAGLAFFLLVDYTIGFAVSGTPTSVNEQRVRDPATRAQLHQFFRSLPADRFPALVALGEHVWVDNRDERFTAGLDVLVDGLEQARNASSDRS
jgi:TetR/AcrR family tetracycline transcriptional repressor